MKIRKPYGGAMCIALMLTALSGLQASRRAPSPPKPSGAKYAAYYGKTDSNHCVNDVIKTFGEVPGKVTKTGGYGAAWNNRMMRFPRYTPNVFNNFGRNNHFQGINRLNAHVGLGNYAVVSGGDPHSNTAHLFVVKIDSRVSGRSGGVPRWGGNRYSTPNGPPAADRVVAIHNLDTYYWHGGGMQTLGRYLAVPVENGGAKKSRVYVYDMANPFRPIRLPYFIQRYRKGGAAALTKMTNGYYVMAVWADSDGKHRKELDFYVSRAKSLYRGWRYVTTWNKAWVKSAYGQGKTFDDFQTVNFINQCDGKLFLVGMHNGSKAAPTIPGRDFADLYRVDLKGGANFYTGRARPRDIIPTVTKVANKHLYCRDDQCNFDGAGGAFIPDNNSIWIYGAYHWLKSEGRNRLLRFNEYASRKTVRGGRDLRGGGFGGRITAPGPVRLRTR